MQDEYVCEWVSEQCDQTDYRRLLSIGTAARSNEPKQKRNETETETEKKRNGTERYGTERNETQSNERAHNQLWWHLRSITNILQGIIDDSPTQLKLKLEIDESWKS